MSNELGGNGNRQRNAHFTSSQACAFADAWVPGDADWDVRVPVPDGPMRLADQGWPQAGGFGTRDPGSLWEFDANAAAAIGGTSLRGGCRTIIGTLIGCLTFGAYRNGLTLMRVYAFYRLLARGIIIAAMLIEPATTDKQGG